MSQLSKWWRRPFLFRVCVSKYLIKAYAYVAYLQYMNQQKNNAEALDSRITRIRM